MHNFVYVAFLFFFLIILFQILFFDFSPISTSFSFSIPLYFCLSLSIPFCFSLCYSITLTLLFSSSFSFTCLCFFFWLSPSLTVIFILCIFYFSISLSLSFFVLLCLLFTSPVINHLFPHLIPLVSIPIRLICNLVLCWLKPTIPIPHSNLLFSLFLSPHPQQKNNYLPPAPPILFFSKVKDTSSATNVTFLLNSLSILLLLY
ncbi:unnamed protein product [Acanthosepion pharaonis]|uniref:Uncharacterized protein n=1 Tax=Acanthosepion pharaonis TaxID=158019 RepID=A0A812AQI8_ACAPH|nr:unnamed protein product [Sepia pharaonis]